jgi:hypothetical protein
MTSFNDSQLMYWEPATCVATLRTLRHGDPRRLLLRCKLEAAGHGGASGRYDRWRDAAFEMGWMLAHRGQRPQPTMAPAQRGESSRDARLLRRSDPGRHHAVSGR